MTFTQIPEPICSYNVYTECLNLFVRYMKIYQKEVTEDLTELKT